MNDQAPFLDVKSFVAEEGIRDEIESETSGPTTSPFLSLYEFEESGGVVDPEAEEFSSFLNELYDEEFDEALSALVDEAATIHEGNVTYEQEDLQSTGYEGERLLNQHFAPLVAESEALFEAMAEELGRRDLNSVTQDEIETMVDQYQPSIELAPSFEDFLGALKKVAKKVAKKALDVAKKGALAAATFGIAPLLNKIKGLLPLLFRRVIQTAIGKLPPYLQPVARKLAERLPFLKELEEDYEQLPETTATYGVGEIQREFDQQVGNILFAGTEVEQDLELARASTDQHVPDTYPLAELDRARDHFVENLRNLKEGEDPTPHVENFVPALIPVLRLALRAAGRENVVKFLAKLLGKLIVKFVGPQYAPALSRAIVDSGLRLLQLEAAPEDESEAAASVVADTVEETVRRVAAAPDTVLDNQELLQGFALEAFEQAAAANLPEVLSEETYRKRPDLAEARRLRGIWIRLPRGRRRRRRYKKFSRRISTRLTPHKVASLETFEGIPLESFLEEQLGIEPGEEVEAVAHLYEAIPGTRLSDIAREEESIAAVDAANGHDQLHPLTREAATLLVGEPELGRDADPRYVSDPHTPQAGQRFYSLEVPGKRPLTIPRPGGRVKGRRSTQLRLIFDFPNNKILIHLFLSEIRAQEIAVKLRQHAHVGVVTTRLQRIVERGIRKAFAGAYKRLKVIHEAVTPDQWTVALRRLPSVVLKILSGRLQEWLLKGLSDYLKQRPEELIKAAEDTADGVTMVITIENPPGFPQLRQALKGNAPSLGSLKMADGAPTVRIRTVAGYTRE